MIGSDFIGYTKNENRTTSIPQIDQSRSMIANEKCMGINNQSFCDKMVECEWKNNQCMIKPSDDNSYTYNAINYTYFKKAIGGIETGLTFEDGICSQHASQDACNGVSDCLWIVRWTGTRKMCCKTMSSCSSNQSDGRYIIDTTSVGNNSNQRDFSATCMNLSDNGNNEYLGEPVGY